MIKSPLKKKDLCVNFFKISILLGCVLPSIIFAACSPFGPGTSSCYNGDTVCGAEKFKDCQIGDPADELFCSKREYICGGPSPTYKAGTWEKQNGKNNIDCFECMVPQS